LSNKKKILVFIDWFYPGYLAGGPVQSIVSIVEHLHDDFDFWIFTSNRDLNSTEPYVGIESNVWVDSDLNCKIYYADKSHLSKRLISEILGAQSWHKVYINSLFSKYYSVIPLLFLKRKFQHLPVVVAPRGMFGSGALSIKKAKKRFFLFYARHSGLHKQVLWHAASSRETFEIRKMLGGKAVIQTIDNLSKRLKFGVNAKKEKGNLTLVFSSRISAVKNVLFAIQVLSKVKIAVKFHLYGLMEDEVYWKQCMEASKQLPVNIQMEYKGTFLPTLTSKIYQNADALFLPTLNENYGHSIVESLSCGCPVIISDQTPWKDIEQYGAGYALPLTNIQAFVDAIEKMGNMDEAQFSDMRKKAILYIQKKINKDNILQQYKRLFNE